VNGTSKTIGTEKRNSVMKIKYTVHSCAPTRLVREVRLADGVTASAYYDGVVVELVPVDHPESGTVKLSVKPADKSWADGMVEGATVEATFKVVSG
jgi:hypothetical protein